MTAVASPAKAMDFAVSLESGLVGTNGDNWSMLGGGGIDTLGLSGSIGIDDHIQAIAGFSIGGKGAKNYLTDPNVPGDAEGFVASLMVAQLNAGLRYDLLPESSWIPFASARGEVLLGNMRLDDDLQHKDNINQIEQSALSAGGSLGLGVAWEGAVSRINSTFRVEIEGGFGLATDLSLGELGNLGIGGGRMRGSVGVLF